MPSMEPSVSAGAGAVVRRSNPSRPFFLRMGKKLRPHIDRLIAGSSMVSNELVLDAGAFCWTGLLAINWQIIRDEAIAVALNPEAVPALKRISPDHARIATDDRWRSFFLIGYGTRIEQNISRCPQTAAILEKIPGLNSGFFSILQPGAHIPRHRGVTKGLLTCHLGLVVPEGELYMEVAGRTVHWSVGRPLIFDDTHPHEVWNRTGGTRVVLLIQFERPLRQPGRAIARAFLTGIRKSAFVREARANIDKWEESLRRIEAAANV